MRIADYLRLLLLAAIWGASFLFMRIAVPQFGAINTAFLRVFFGSTGLAVILFIFKSSFDFKDKFKSSVMLGVINSGLPFLMYCLAAKWLPAGVFSHSECNNAVDGGGDWVCIFCREINLQKMGWHAPGHCRDHRDRHNW